MDKGLGKIESSIENQVRPDIKTLYECQVQTIKKLEEHDVRFDKIEEAG
ncbi:MAG: hypothetical protein Q8920_01850 [Bacillota bacterium]|nr:hypothetical protein [Bacillota bacterium]